MECPNCHTKLKNKDFFNISLLASCPGCRKKLVFNPSFVPLILFVAISYVTWNMLPHFGNFWADLVVGLLVTFIFMVVILRLMLLLDLGKITEYQTKLK